MPKISFVVPSKNRIAWLPECLVSLLDQTEKDIEVIVVNDGSNDGTKEFLDDWAMQDPRVKVIHNETSLAAGKSRNIGMEAAASEIIGVMDDDDTVPEDRAEVTLRWFREHPESELVTFPYMRIGYFGEHLEPFWGTDFDHEAFKKDGSVSYFCNPACAYKKKSAEEMGGYPSENSQKTDDIQFLENWVKAGKRVDFDNRAMTVLHRVMPQSMMASQRGWRPEWVVGAAT